MSSPLPLLRPVLEDLLVVSSATGFDVPAERRSTGNLQPSAGKTGRVVEASESVRFSAPPSSLSNGETFVRTCDSRGDITADVSECVGSNEKERRQYGLRPSIELPALPERPLLRAMALDEKVTASSAAGRLRSEEDDGGATGSLTTSPLQGVWSHHVYVDPISTGRGDSVAVLSDAAALMIAHAVHRSSLLQQCFTQWQVQQARHVEWRLHREYFAEGYYQRNLLYLFFRAWQWRHDRRFKCADQRRMLEELRARHLRHRAFVAWRSWKAQRKKLRERVGEMQARNASTLTRRCFERWHHTSTHRALARAAAQLSADGLRDERFRCWRRFVLQRRKGRILVSAFAIYTPSAWTTAQQSSCDELHRLHTWIQWLRVTMQRRACRLQRYERALSAVTVRAEQSLRQGRYVRWLQVTCASLHLRHARRGLIERYYNKWAFLGCLGQKRLQWERETDFPHRKQRCLAQWRDRLCKRRTSRKHLQMAELFFESVMQAHTVGAAFRYWSARRCNRAKAQRMRRVAEGYARPALLRHLFLRHVTDSVLASPAGLEGALEFKRHCRGADTSLLTPTESAGASNDRRVLEVAAKTPASSSQHLRRPIPLHHHRGASSETSSVPVTCPDAPLEPEGMSSRTEGADKARMITVSAPEHAVEMAVLLPPPPSYEEVVGSSRVPDTICRVGGCAPPLRADVGVGTTCEAPTLAPCATPRISSGGDRSASRPDTIHQREEAAPPLVATLPAGARNASAAAVPCYAVLGDAPVGWTLGFVPARSGWPTLDILAPSSASVTPLASATPASHGACYRAPLAGGMAPAEAELTAFASFGQGCREGDAEVSSVAYGPRKPSTSPSAALPLPCKGFPPAPPSPRTHYGFDIHRHVDPLAPLTPSSSRATRASDAGCVDILRQRGGQRHKAQRRCAQLPAVNLGSAILSQGRVPLSFAGRRAESEKDRALLSPERKEAGGAQSVSSASPSSSSSLSSRSSSASAAPRASDATPFPLCPAPSIADPAALRAQARDVLGDYKSRTRLIAAERAELATIEAQLALAPHAKDIARKKELSRRRRYLQRRLLEWEQRRAQVRQLAVWLEGRVSAATSAAVSQAGVGELSQGHCQLRDIAGS
ncbi:hypothetical protein LSCM4_03202 [Leishmania orientalis]|uniref:Sfi1 spindle body domain-containing protein n=1 Tax=Leishmania orientalis TaxID=2249476 RepID=A0A836KF38_9TRYP|nr:hypothetical protein LSCM4_03202 [Leishmania orientalis]